MLSKPPPADDTILFEAAILPHRSLSPRGRRLLIGGICVLLLLTGTRFWLIGAWPVAGFIVLELGLAAFLLWLHQRSARRVELLLLSQDVIRVVRTDPDGRKREMRLPTGWLNVELEERPGRVPGLLLCIPGRRLEVAAALGEGAKRDLAQALGRAVGEVRNPRFDNPQLREA
jgi:uncharacterized membrane protein